MANDKKFVPKNGLRTQNISFVDADPAVNEITVRMLNTDTLSFTGNSGQLFSITDSLTGTIFAVNDISGVPSIEVDDDGTIRFAETFGNVLIGTNSDDGVNKLQISGNTAFTGTLRVNGALYADTITLPNTHSKTKISLYDGGDEFIGTSTNVLELSGANINLNGADGTGSANLQIGGTTVIDSSRNLANIGTGSFSGNVRLASTNYIQFEVDQTDSAAVYMGVTSATTEGFVAVSNKAAGHLTATVPILKILHDDGTIVESARFSTSGIIFSETLTIKQSSTNGNALQLQAGDVLDGIDSRQITFGFNNTNNYAHSIRTRHNSNAATGNAIDFYIWDQTVDTIGTIGTLNMLTLEGGSGLDLKSGDYKVNGTSIIDSSANIVNVGDITITGSLKGPATLYIDPSPDDTGEPGGATTDTGTVVILGDLQVTGATTTVDSTSVAISDLNITLAKDATTAAQANGAGFTVAGAGATLVYGSTTDSWTLNKPLTVQHETTDDGGLILQKTDDLGSRNDLVIKSDFDRDVGITFTTLGGSYEIWQDSAGDDSLIFSPGIGGGVALELYQSGAAYFANNVGIGQPSPTSRLHLYQSAAAPTLLTLHNYQSDIVPNGTQGNFIDFQMTDDNATFTPQVRIGMLVQDSAGDAGIPSEGRGNFVVYTGIGSGDLGAGTLTEKLRVSELGDVTISVGDLDVVNGNLTADFVLARDNIVGTYPTTSKNGSTLKGTILEHAIEANGVIDPSQYNWLAGAHSRHTVTVTLAGTPVSVNGSMFQGDSSHASYALSNATNELVITISGLSNVNYGAYVGVTFGNGNFRARGVKIETFRNGAWQTECDLTGQTATTVSRQVANNDANGVTEVRYTFKDPVNTGSLRINTLWLVNYNTSRVSEGYDWNRYGSTVAYGDVDMRSTTDSTSTSTGSLTLDGGAGIALSLSVGGNINLTGDLKMVGTDSYIWSPATASGYTGIYDPQNSRAALQYRNDYAGVGILRTAEQNIALSVQGNSTAQSKAFKVTHGADSVQLAQFISTGGYAYVNIAGAAGQDSGIVFSEGDSATATNRRMMIGYSEAVDQFRVYTYYKRDGVTAVNANRMTIDSDGNMIVANELAIGSSSLGGGAATQQGHLKLPNGGSQISPNTRGGIEFVHATVNNGYAHRIVGFDNTGGDVPLVIQRRNNSTSWTDQVTFEGNSNNVVFAGNILAPSISSFASVATTDIPDQLVLQTERVDFGEAGGNAILFKNQDGNNATNEARIKVVTENSTNYVGINNEGSSHFVFNMTDNGTATDRVVFRSDGYVGIGILKPLANLHVRSASSGQTTAALTDAGVNHGLLRISDQNTAAGAGGGIIFANAQGDNAGSKGFAAIKSLLANGSGNTQGDLAFSLRTSTTDTALTERVRIKSNGRIGFGNVDPKYRLDLYGSNAEVGNTFAASFGGRITAGNFTGIHFGYSEDNNTLYRKSAIVFERTDLTATDGQGKIHILNGPQGNSNSATLADAKLTIIENGYVGINTTSPGYNLEVNGSFAATTKSFVIDHPTKEGMQLRYGSLEGPENGVYVRGRLKGSKVIELPDYWTGLVHEDSITVSLTAVGGYNEMWVDRIEDNKVYVNSTYDLDCFYHVFAERKDVDKLEVEF